MSVEGDQMRSESVIISLRNTHEAFVKSFKRDYVAFSDPENAYDTMRQLPDWFEDYNENAPHKGLQVMIPREFIRSLSVAN